jgi:two-component system, cell cycle response regulator DivK
MTVFAGRLQEYSAESMAKGLILVVDDLPDPRELCSVALVKEGYKVAVAGKGNEALERALSLRPDLIVMDIRLPEMSGWEAIEKLKADERTRSIPIVGLTAYTYEGSRVEALKAKCHAFLMKPCPPDKLIKVIRRILGNANSTTSDP